MDLFNYDNQDKELYNQVLLGDNLRVMNTLSLNCIDFIYIDPPYNTNNKFSYNDSNKIWADDISERIRIAKKLLKDKGVICISIDDNELVTLLNICFNIFGKENYVGIFITHQSQRSNAKYINIIHEYVVVFAKNKNLLNNFYIKRLSSPDDKEMIKSIITKVKNAFLRDRNTAQNILKNLLNQYAISRNITWIKNYTNIDEEGRIFFAKDLSTPGQPAPLSIDEINLYLPALKTRRWSTKEKFIYLYKQNRLCFKKGRPYEKQYLEEAVDNIPSILNFYSRQGTNDLKKLGLYGYFDTPKPVELIKFLIRAMMHQDATILDFYAGSGTTAQAVYEINQEDKINHRFILIQSKEPVAPTSDVYKKLTQVGYVNPSVSDILILRLHRYLKIHNLPIDFEIKEYE
ncbi:MAG: site-specific DNA-methyltransferase [Alphaproteobacteria bacterium]|nr:site-specific DNA-methyltransferase [Alphaproteobacteria bacterium]